MLVRLLFFAALVAFSSLIAVAGSPPASDHWLEGPIVSGNLSVYLVHGRDVLRGQRYLTLTKGLAQQKVVVTSGDQGLAVENRSDQDLFIQAGEIVKGSLQDRTFGQDLLVSAHTGAAQTVPAQSGPIQVRGFCVEHDRSGARGNEDVLVYGSSSNILPSKSLKKAMYAEDQEALWKNVTVMQHKLLAAVGPTLQATELSTASLELTLDDLAVTNAIRPYGVDLDNMVIGSTDDTLGLVTAINGRLNNGDVYGSAELFKGMFPKLLRAAKVEALSERMPGWESRAHRAPKADMVQGILDAADAVPVEVKGEVRDFMPVTVQLPTRPAPASPSAVVGGEHAEVVKKQTTNCVQYESRDTHIGAPFVHRAYLLTPKE